MSTVNGEIFRGVGKGYQTIEITYPNSFENLLSTPIVIMDTANPTSVRAQAKYTLTASDFPVINGNVKVSWGMMIQVAGKSLAATSRSILYQPYVNSTAIITQGNTSIAAGRYYTLKGSYLGAIKPGDVISMSLWCTAASSQFDYDYMCVSIYPTRIAPPKGALFEDITYDNIIPIPVCTLGAPSLNSGLGVYAYPPSAASVYTTNPFSFDCMLTFRDTNSANFYKISSGDRYVSVSGAAHASARPYYSANYVPTRITYKMKNIENKSL